MFDVNMRFSCPYTILYKIFLLLDFHRKMKVLFVFCQGCSSPFAVRVLNLISIPLFVDGVLFLVEDQQLISCANSRTTFNSNANVFLYFPEPHKFQLWTYIFQARDLVAKDDSGMNGEAFMFCSRARRLRITRFLSTTEASLIIMHYTHVYR